jgi:hypothetical protein
VSARRAMLLLLAGGLLGCAGITDPPAGDTPFVYLLLSPTPVSNLQAVADSTPWAVVATLPTLVDARYRSTASFHLRRTRDGALFVWQSREMTAGFPGGWDELIVAGGANANVTLAAAGDSGGLGWRALTGGDTYTLDAIAEGTHITGEATIPERPMLAITDSGSAHTVRWPKARGAAGYYVAPAGRPLGSFTTDTAIKWCENPYDPPGSPRYVRVVALDANAFRYLGDTTTAQAGVHGALGLFGGANEARIEPSTPRPTDIDPNCSPVLPSSR